jgi:hypothetical protein
MDEVSGVVHELVAMKSFRDGIARYKKVEFLTNTEVLTIMTA